MRISATTADMARQAADTAAGTIRRGVDRDGVARVMFATGNSQLAFIDVLTAYDLPWHQVAIFHMDEYVGMGPDHPASFQRWIRERIADRVRPLEAHYIDGLADPAAECARYAALLDASPFHLCCLGIGENGHLAFNDPGVARFDDPLSVRVVELDEACRAQQVGEGHFATGADVPRRAITVTIPALLRAEQVLAVVPEARKAAPVAAALTGPVETSCPASILQRTPHAVIYLDPASASLLPPPD